MEEKYIICEDSLEGIFTAIYDATSMPPLSCIQYTLRLTVSSYHAIARYPAVTCYHTITRYPAVSSYHTIRARLRR